ncbi:hypothetical protein F511_17166 [Dorcoceras hygrometricum]|uniref:Dystroglycan-like n=1 Tax=Dorcoceras hygrometricum TaxID=472368 RepID=A0A2Z7C3A5_9LAMI|nr:hypothetical protein F511_17166 [Dorcoceras hygrometricum]
MASSLFVNTLQVDFTSVLTMEHAGMVRMFKTLKDTGLRGFLEATTPVFESAVVEYFSNSRVLAGTIVSAVCGQKLVVMEDIFSGTFKLPTQGMKNFYGIPTETISEMRTRFSATTVTFQSSGKKRDLLFEYRLLHDIVAKSLCAKAGSFDKVTCEKFEFMVAISAGISVNWGRILFQRLLAMVQTPRKQSQGFTVQVSMLMELLVRADLGTTTKLHVKKVLTRKQVQNYLKGNQVTTPTKETASNTAGGTSQQVPPEVTQSLADDTEQGMLNPRKRKHKGEAMMTKYKQDVIPNITAHIPTENRGIVVSTNDDPEEESETDSCPLVPRQCRATQVSESSESLPLTHLLKCLRTQRPDHTIPPDPIPAHGDEQRDHGSHEQGIGDINLEEGLYQDNQKKHESQSEPDLVTTAGASLFTDTILTASNEENIAEQFAHGSEEPETIAPTLDAQIHSASASADQYCQSLIASAREKVSTKIAIFEEWVHFRLEVRLKDLSSFECMINSEEQLLEWAETEDITELSERRSLILYKILETELEQLYLAHLANFKTSVASAHYDFECIRLLHQELRLIAVGHRHHRGLAGLPLTSLECDFLPKFSPQSEIYHFTGTAQGSVLDAYKHVNQTAAHTPHEHQAQETVPQIQMPDRDTHGHDGQSSEDGFDPKINAIPISAINFEELPKSSTLQLLHNVTQSLNVISTHVSSLDQSYALLCDDSLITRHHTTKLRNELKITAEGFDIKIDVLERTLTQRLIDELLVVKSQLACLVEDLKRSGAAKKGEGGSSSRPMEGPSI